MEAIAARRARAQDVPSSRGDGDETNRSFCTPFSHPIQFPLPFQIAPSLAEPLPPPPPVKAVQNPIHAGRCPVRPHHPHAPTQTHVRLPAQTKPGPSLSDFNPDVRTGTARRGTLVPGHNPRPQAKRALPPPCEPDTLLGKWFPMGGLLPARIADQPSAKFRFG